MAYQFSIIPDFGEAEKSLELKEKWNLNFEWNDFYVPTLLDDEVALENRMQFWGEHIKAKHLQSRSCTMHGPFLDISIHSLDRKIAEASRTRLEQAMDIARRMSLGAVVVHSGLLRGFEDGAYINRWLERNEQIIRELLQTYPDVSIYMENMFEEHPKHLKMLAGRLQDCAGFGICLDYSHAAIFGREIEEWLEVLAPYLRHMHINDHDGISDKHLAVGKGVTDWERWQRNLEKYAYKGTILLEMPEISEQEYSLDILNRMGILAKT